jgi:hypothetical protein
MSGFLVSFTARTPRDVFRSLQDHYNQILNKVLTRYRVRFTIHQAKQERTALSFFNGEGEHIAVPLAPSPWYLFIRQRLQAVSQGNSYSLQVLAYEYRIQRTSSPHDEAEVRFEYVSPEIDPGFPYSRHHVQFHQDYHAVRESFSLQKLHIPTGGVTIEHVTRFLIADLGVPPLVDDWDEELRRSEEQSREWVSKVY